MNKETLKYRIEYALEHIYKYDIEVEICYLGLR